MTNRLYDALYGRIVMNRTIIRSANGSKKEHRVEHTDNVATFLYSDTPIIKIGPLGEAHFDTSAFVDNGRNQNAVCSALQPWAKIHGYILIKSQVHEGYDLEWKVGEDWERIKFAFGKPVLLTQQQEI